MYCENPNDDDDACNGMPMRMRMQTVSRPKYAQYPGLDERIIGTRRTKQGELQASLITMNSKTWRQYIQHGGGCVTICRVCDLLCSGAGICACQGRQEKR